MVSLSSLDQPMIRPGGDMAFLHTKKHQIIIRLHWVPEVSPSVHQTPMANAIVTPLKSLWNHHETEAQPESRPL